VKVLVKAVLEERRYWSLKSLSLLGFNSFPGDGYDGTRLSRMFEDVLH
jgi:hypothetical protein